MESMTSSGKILKEVLDEQGISYSFVDDHKVVFAINTPRGGRQYVINNIWGINSASDVKLCADKAYAYDLISDVVAMPRTQAFLDPQSIYAEGVAHQTQADVVTAIRQSFILPVVIKKNSGSLGTHVFLCRSQEAVAQAVQKIFNRQSAAYDHVLIAQEAIDIAVEWRVLMLDGTLQFMYRKDTSMATFTGNLSPLHWEASRAVLETDPVVQAQTQKFLDPMFVVWQLPYGGFDVVRDQAGKLWLIEVNSHPAFAHFLHDCDSQPLKALFRKLLTRVSQ